MSEYTLLDSVWEDIKRCYRCGYCRDMVRDLTGTFRTCPTREQLRFEQYTARGRNTIARGLVEGNLKPSWAIRDLAYTCLGCGGCKESCSLIDWAKIDTPAITRAMRGEFHKRGMTPRKIRNMLRVKTTAAADGEPTCSASCPIGQDIPSYIAFVAKGDYQSAADVIRRDNPLPSVCGRACAHPCEASCRQGEIGEPVSIMRLKRFCLDWEKDNGRKDAVAPVPITREAVAVVGSGPAGLAAAAYLRRRGFGVTVFEREKAAGGMVRLAIPDYVLPEPEVARDIGSIEAMGVTIRTGVAIGPEYPVDKLLAEGFAAVLVCCGTWTPLRPSIPGSDLQGVTDGIEFLTRIKRGEDLGLSGRIAVIGGGETAVDVARTALRMGLGVDVLYRRSREEMPVTVENLEYMLAEGAILHEGLAPLEILGVNGSVSGVTAKRVRYTEYDDDGKMIPVFAEGSEETIPCGALVWAVGQRPDDVNWQGSLAVRVTSDGRICTNADGLAADRVWAAGDCVSGPTSIVEAMASGLKAAKRMAAAFGATEEPETRRGLDAQRPAGRVEVLSPRALMPHREATGEHDLFAECELGFTETTAREEAMRCLGCDSRCGKKAGQGTVLFFAGCNNRHRFPGAVRAALTVLEQGGLTVVTSDAEQCCGSPARWSGDNALADALRDKNLAIFRDMGVTRIITACADCLAALQQDYPLQDAGITVEHFAAAVHALAAEGTLHLKAYPGKLTYHDPCQLARTSGCIDAPREILRAVAGERFMEMPCRGRSTQCCGGGPNNIVGLAAPGLANSVTAARLDEAASTGADTLVTACSWCRTRFASNKTALRVFDFPEFIQSLLA